MAMFEAIRWTTRGLISSTCRPTVIGLENVPKEGPFIVAPNHLSFLDSVIVQALMPRPVAFFAKAEYFTTGGVKGKVMKSFFEAVGSIPVEFRNSVAVLALLKLGAITERTEYNKQAAEKTLRLFGARLQSFPQAVPYLLLAFDFSLGEPRRVMIVGDPAKTETRTLLRAAHSVYQPNKVVLGNAGPVEPFAKTLPAKDGATVYLCTGTACQAPTRDPVKIRELLK